MQAYTFHHSVSHLHLFSKVWLFTDNCFTRWIGESQSSDSQSTAYTWEAVVRLTGPLPSLQTIQNFCISMELQLHPLVASILSFNRSKFCLSQSSGKSWLRCSSTQFLISPVFISLFLILRCSLLSFRVIRIVFGTLDLIFLSCLFFINFSSCNSLC